MKKLAAVILLISCAPAALLQGQIAASPVSSAAPVKKAEKAIAKGDKSSTNQLFGALQSNEPTTTEIYADEAFFDSTKNKGIFSGRVKVTDPRFNLQSDRLKIEARIGYLHAAAEDDLVLGCIQEQGAH